MIAHCRYLSIPPYTKSMPSIVLLRSDIFLKPTPTPLLLTADQTKYMVMVIFCVNICVIMKLY